MPQQTDFLRMLDVFTLAQILPRDVVLLIQYKAVWSLTCVVLVVYNKSTKVTLKWLQILASVRANSGVWAKVEPWD